jgi:hypothetical protein
MGTKFSHFNILNSSIDQTMGLLTLIPKRPNALEVMKRLAPDNELFNKPINEIKKPENSSDEQWQKFQKDWTQATKYMKSQKRAYYVGQNQNWITVFSEEFGFGSIDVYTLPLSKKISNTFLTVGLFDEDVLILTIIKNGNILTRYVCGGQSYEIEDTFGDINIFAEAFNIIPQKTQLEQILKNNDDNLYKKIEELEKLCNLKLWINRSLPRELKWKKVTV